MKKILTIGCQDFRVAEWRKEFPGIDIVSVGDILDAMEYLYADPEVAVVIVDGLLFADQPETNIGRHVRMLRDRFSGPMIAIARNIRIRNRLSEAGCDFQCDRLDLPEKLREVLGSPGSTTGGA